MIRLSRELRPDSSGALRGRGGIVLFEVALTCAKEEEAVEAADAVHVEVGAV